MNRPKKEKGIRRTHNVMVRFKQRCLPPHTLESSRMCKSTEDFPIRQGLLKIRRRKIFKNNNLFEIVKLNITTRQAAEAYGFRPNRSSMICCPFHADRNPSMKVDFICFAVFLFVPNCEIFKTVFKKGSADSYSCKGYTREPCNGH